MAKLRLTQELRRRLVHLADRLIVTPAETAALDAAYEAAAPFVRLVVAKRFPPKDMAVLKKYDAAGEDHCIRLAEVDTNNVKQFNFRINDTAPLRPLGSCRRYVYLAEPDLFALVKAWEEARDAQKGAHDDKLRAYKALIFGSKYLEDVTAIWPEAEKLRPAGHQVPATITEDLAARIKADVALRAAAPAEA